ncbi:E4 [Gammapapillomavirus 19]|uniref:E4 n=1 Tax=Gammapapillomavirus 19 TaxID=1513264 RepID=A0A2D2ALZ7_9PAPI|nr:E4 [Gammapapillomavirus 19]
MMIQIKLFLIHVGNGYIIWTRMMYGKKQKGLQITMGYILKSLMVIGHILQYLTQMLSNMDYQDNGQSDLKIL